MASDHIFKLVNHEVFLVTTHYQGQDSGMIATWIIPATLAKDQYRIAAAFSINNMTTDLLLKSRWFTIQLLSETQWELVPRFGLYSGRSGNDKFLGLSMTRSSKGAPLVSGTCGWMECCIVEEIHGGDRVIVVADVTGHGLGVSHVPLLKQQAFKQLSQAQRLALEKKYEDDAVRDLALIRMFPHPLGDKE